MPDHDMNVPLPADARSGAPVELREVTEQLLLTSLREHALAEQLEHRLAISRAIAARLTEGLCAIDQHGRVTFLNAAAEQMLGWLDAEARGLEAELILQELDAASKRKRVLPLNVGDSGATSRTDRAVLLHKDGTTFPVAYAVATIVVNEHVVGTVVTFDNLAEVERLKELQDEYLALMSHDLRTPLTTMIGYAQLLLRQLSIAALERATHSAEAIVASGATMERILKDIMERSQMQAGLATLRLAPLDLVQVVAQSIDQNMLPEDTARITIQAVSPLPIIADAIQVERVIVNVLTNACKYSAATAPVVVQVMRIHDNAVISVTDQGVGIDVDDLPHLFEKYYRAKTAGTTQGVGLGLFGSQLIIQAHGGCIEVESAKGQGSTFRVVLPVFGESPQ
jgi:PAS domain S-box-containing protein